MGQSNAHRQKKIGILGGSFDPIHNGHLAIAESAADTFSLDEVWLIPAGHSPNKEESCMTPAALRLRMTELAAASHPDFRASDVEVAAEGTSYTYRTLEKLAHACPDVSFFFIMGADSLDYFEKWVHPERICHYATILVAVRDDFTAEDLRAKIAGLQTLFAADIRILPIARMDVSSHEIRRKIAAGEDVSADIPAAVYDFILETGLYQTSE